MTKMDRYEAQYSFWASFGVPAYEENSVPTGDEFPGYPYITYEAVTGGFNADIFVNAYIWTRSSSWTLADFLADKIDSELKHGGKLIPYDSGAIWVTAEDNFAQNMGDATDNMIKRKVLSVVLHFS